MRLWMLAFIFVSLTSDASDVDCNSILSNSIDHLAELRIDLDQKLSRGQSGILAKALEIEYQKKTQELLAIFKNQNGSESSFDLILKNKIQTLQKGVQAEDAELIKIQNAQDQELSDHRADEIHSLKDLPFGLKNHAQTMTADGKVIVTGGVTEVFTENHSVFVIDPVKDTLQEFKDVFKGSRKYHAQMLLNKNTLLVVGGNKPYTIDILNLKKMKITRSIRSKRNDVKDALDVGGRPRISVQKDGLLWIYMDNGIEVVDLKKKESLSYFPHTEVFGTEVSFLNNWKLISFDAQGMFLVNLFFMRGLMHPEPKLTSANVGRTYHSQVVLDGHLLTVGGKNASGDAQVASVQLIDLKSGDLIWSAELQEPRYRPSLDVTSDGRVVVSGGWISDPKPVAGGSSNVKTLQTIEVIDPKNKSLETLAILDDPAGYPTTGLTPDNRWVAVGGALSNGIGLSLSNAMIGSSASLKTIDLGKK